MITAGHCCSSGTGTFYSNWLFEPAHVNGTAPFGSWPAASAYVFNVWHNGEDLSRDVCVLKMSKVGGQSINDAVGALGYAWDLPLPQAYTATGWPQNPPFNGGVLFYSFASDAETDTEQGDSLPFTHGIGNHMTGGSSGGAWIHKFQSHVAGTKNFFNGLNSYKYISPNRPAEMFGPYIDGIFINTLFKTVATSAPAP